MDSGGGSLGLHTSDSRMTHTMIMQDFGKAFSLLYFLSFFFKTQNKLNIKTTLKKGSVTMKTCFFVRKITFVGLISLKLYVDSLLKIILKILWEG